MTEVHAELTGPEGAPVLVLAHSIGTTSALWDGSAAALAERYRVVRYDTRGHGRSPVPAGPYTLADLGGDVLELLDRIGAGTASFAGVSLGGMTGMWLAEHAPDRLDALIVICTSADAGGTGAWADRAALVTAEGMAPIAATALDRWFTPAFQEREPALMDHVLTALRRTSPAGYASCALAIEGMELAAGLAEVRVPTLVVAGSEDPATPPEHGRRIADAIPGARFELVTPARHLANLEQPDVVTDLIVGHLTERGIR